MPPWICAESFPMRRAFASEAWLGTTDWHHDRLAELIVSHPPVGSAGTISRRMS
jgi:hypothetical protein